MKFSLCSTLFSLITVFSLQAGEFSKEIVYKNYRQAIKGDNSLRFVMESTKIGFIRTNFDGSVKKFDLRASLEGDTLKSAEVVFNVRDMDTNQHNRNSKMYREILNYKSWPRVKVEIKGPLKLRADFSVPAIMTIRGKAKVLTLNFKARKDEGYWVISGHSMSGIKELELPDPSMGIGKLNVASVANEIDIRVKFKIPVK